MPESNNTEFDLQVRIEKQLHDNTHEKVKNHQALNDDEIKLLCPVAFKRRMVNSEIAKLGLSKHYSFVPTTKVVDDLRSMGWECVDAQQVKARKKSTNGYQKHMLTFEHPDYKVDGATEYPQLLLTNSHDGGNAFTLSAGIFRMICSNGLVIKSEDYGDARLVHKGYSFDAVQKLVTDFTAEIDTALQKVTAMKRTQLTTDQIIAFAKQAALLRFKGNSYNEDNIADVVELDELHSSTRPEDNGNGLWEVYNRVQESLINGNYHYKVGVKSRKGRTIKSFKQNIDVNKKLSEIAFELVA
jgi:hypothetical protein